MDNLTIQNHLRGLSGIGQLNQRPEIPGIESAGIGQAEEAPESNFKDMLAESINKVNGLMNESDKAIEDLVTGKSANMHHTLIALQKADVSFRMLLEVRNKVMNAYSEVMRMQT